MLGLSESGIEKIRKSLGASAEDASDKTIRFFLPEWLRAWAKYTVGAVLDPNGELEDAESDSPWLEEKRKWGAKREQVKYEAEIGQLVPRTEVRRDYLYVAGPLRRSAELMCPDCRTHYEEALDEADENMDRVYPADDSPSNNHD